MSEDDPNKPPPLPPPAPLQLEYFSPSHHLDERPPAAGAFGAGCLIGFFAIFLFGGICALTRVPAGALWGLIAGLALIAAPGIYAERRTAYFLGALLAVFFGFIIVASIP